MPRLRDARRNVEVEVKIEEIATPEQMTTAVRIYLRFYAARFRRSPKKGMFLVYDWDGEIAFRISEGLLFETCPPVVRIG
jgi:hypothetical protein